MCVYAVYLIHMQRTNIYLAVQQLTRLKALSKQVGVSVSELIRRAIDLFIEKTNKGE